MFSSPLMAVESWNITGNSPTVCSHCQSFLDYTTTKKGGGFPLKDIPVGLLLGSLLATTCH